MTMYMLSISFMLPVKMRLMVLMLTMNHDYDDDTDDDSDDDANDDTDGDTDDGGRGNPYTIQSPRLL